MHANERRVDRMDTWIRLADATPRDQEQEHVQFVFYWIAYEAAYKHEGPERKESRYERQQLHERLARCDGEKLRGLLNAQRRDVVSILELRQAHHSFWHEVPGVRNVEEWERKFAGWVKKDKENLGNLKISVTLDNLFWRLNIVRNQIVHGGSAGPRSLGRTQVMLGARLLKVLVPCFRDIIRLNVDQDWGKPPFPRVGSVRDKKYPPPWLVTRDYRG